MGSVGKLTARIGRRIGQENGAERVRGRRQGPGQGRGVAHEGGPSHWDGGGGRGLKVQLCWLHFS